VSAPIGGVDELVISLTATGLTTGEISAHLADVCGAEVSRSCYLLPVLMGRAGIEPATLGLRVRLHELRRASVS
jgi:hypothetical protein